MILVKWNQPIVLGLDAVGLNHIEQTGSECLKQEWHCETDLRGFFDVRDPNDFPKSVEIWSSIITGRDMAGITNQFQYQYSLGRIKLRVPHTIGKWVEKRGYMLNPLIEPVLMLNPLRARRDFKEALWSYAVKREDTIFAHADEENAVNIVAYNQEYLPGANIRKLMGDYLNANLEYRKQRRLVAEILYDESEKEGRKLDISTIIMNIENTPTDILKRGRLRRMRIKKARVKKRFFDRVYALHDRAKGSFLERLKAADTSDDRSRIDFVYSSKIDSILHLFNDRRLIESLYSGARDFYSEVREIAESQDRPLILVSDHGMEARPGRSSCDHSHRGFFSSNYTLDEMRRNIGLEEPVESEFYYGMPKPQHVGILLKAHLLSGPGRI